MSARHSQKQDAFFRLADRLQSQTADDERFTLYGTGEDSTFVRFNQAAVRQAGEVDQDDVNLTLVRGQRQVTSSWSCASVDELDHARLDEQLERMRFDLDAVEDDPYLMLAGAQPSVVTNDERELVPSNDVIQAILAAGEGVDLVGILAMGDVRRGFANSEGVRSFFQQQSFHFDYSLHLEKDKAVKRSVAGKMFDPNELEHDVAAAKMQLQHLKKPAITLEPQAVRAYLAPAAVAELLSLLSWDAFSEKAHRTKSSPLIGMSDKGRKLNAAITLEEDLEHGTGPQFSQQGFPMPSHVPLVKNGVYQGALVSPRSAQEFDLQPTGANPDEAPTALHMHGGDVDESDILEVLGTGALLNNLWYTNFSDREHARITGMTRFASFWVENGEIQGPLNVMRFDDSLYDILGDGLVGLTASHLMLDGDTYWRRKTKSMRCPGALVDGFRFTL